MKSEFWIPSLQNPNTKIILLFQNHKRKATQEELTKFKVAASYYDNRHLTSELE
jgi:hypothetical protein